MSTDKEIRDQIKKQDYQHVERMKKEMQLEDQEMKKFFQEDQKASGKDPTIRRKSKYDHKIDTLKETMKDFSIFGFYSSFWKYKPLTPEEDETLTQCKKYITKSLLYASAIGMLITTGVNFYYRGYLSIPMQLFGIGMGGMGGAMYGLIRSTEFTLKKLEELGPEYPLGRIAINDIEDYRMDKKRRPGAEDE